MVTQGKSKGSAKSSKDDGKQRFTRGKTGCLTCRTRRKKCSEDRPVCAGCKRNGLPCQWPRQKAWPVSGGSSTKSPEEVSSNGSPKSSNLTDDEITTSWVPSMNAYILSHNARAASLYPTSSTLLSYYLSKTALICSYRPSHTNPFIVQVLPLAAADDLLMNTVLAFGGTHFGHQVDQYSQPQIDTHKHYALALKALRTESELGMMEYDYERSLKLLLVLLLLAHTEAIRGDLNGSIFPHLRACRPMIVQLLARSGPHKMTPFSALEAFVVEMYVYCIMSSRLTPDVPGLDGELDNDVFLTSLDWLKKYPGFGSFLNIGCDLWEKIPVVRSLAGERLALFNTTQFRGLNSPSTPTDLAKQHSLNTQASLLLTELEMWQSPPVPQDLIPWSSSFHSIGYCFREALIIYLKACCMGDTVTPMPPYDEPVNDTYYPIASTALRTEIDTHVLNFFTEIQNVVTSPFAAVCVWPCIITSTCFRDRELGRRAFETIHQVECEMGKMGMCDKIEQTMYLLWNEDDPRAYGPFGLQMVMQRYACDLSVT